MKKTRGRKSRVRVPLTKQNYHNILLMQKISFVSKMVETDVQFSLLYKKDFLYTCICRRFLLAASDFIPYWANFYNFYEFFGWLATPSAPEVAAYLFFIKQSRINRIKLLNQRR
jgi:hypothetical protein